MAIFRTLIRSILKSPNRTTVPRSQHLFPHSVTKSTYAILNPISCASDHRLTSFHSKLFSPACGSISSPSVGPLFLSSPPWMLLQSATPLYLQADVVGSTREVSSSFLRIVGDSEVRKRVVGSNIGRDGRGDAVVVEDSILNLPNLISISRMVSGPVIGWMIINEWYSLSFVALGISGFTDWLDGFAARKMKINSVIGSYLDPLADKVLIASVALAMVKKDLLDAWLVELVVLRDVGLVGGAVYKRASSLDWKWKSWSDFISLNTTCPQKVEPLFISKVNTVLQLTLVAAALLQPGFGTEETQVYITYLSWLVASTTVASTIAYGAQHLLTAASVSAK